MANLSVPVTTRLKLQAQIEPRCRVDLEGDVLDRRGVDLREDAGG